MFKTKIFSPIFAVIGFLFIAAGIMCNVYTLTALFSRDGSIITAAKIAIWIFDIVMLCTGVFLIRIRDNAKMRINTIILSVSILVCLTFVELLLRSQGGSSNFRWFIPNPHGTGSYRLKPNFHLKFRVSNNVITDIKTNSLGMRWREVSCDNVGHKIRVAFAGDSFTFGEWATKIENSFVGVFDGSLDPNRFEVLNFAVPGYGFSDIALRIKEDVLDFKPDYIMLMFWTGNDFYDTYLGKDKYYVKNGMLRVDCNNYRRKVPQIARRKRGVRDFFYTFALVNRIILPFLIKSSYDNIDMVEKLDMKAIKKSDFEYNVNTAYPASEWYWCRKNYSKFAQKVKNRAINELNKIREECAQNNVRLIIVSIPYMGQVCADEPVGENYNIDLPQMYVKQFAAHYSIPYLDLLPSLRSSVKEGVDIFPMGDNHFNDEGHRIIGTRLAVFFKEKVLKDIP